MIVSEEKSQVEGNLVFDEQVEMQLDPTAVAMHIRNMIRMYADPRLAALREYTSNARDSHKASGYKGPVEVTLPTSMHPFLTIVDHGLGLSREEVKGFGQFGRSTKNDSNEYIGGFGLGSKSGLAVATQFTVIAVKDGKKNIVVVGRDENSHPSLGFLAEQDTTESNGVTIQIPSATHHNTWDQIVQGNTFIGWEPGSIVINGQTPTLSVHNTDQFKRLSGGWLTLGDRSSYRSYDLPPVHALVHGVYYKIPVDKFRARSTALTLRGSVLEIPNGSVDILPSRDDLEWTDRTVASVNTAADVLVGSIVVEYQNQINNVKSFREAKAVESAMSAIALPTAGLSFKGVPLDWTTATDFHITAGDVKLSTTAKSGWQTERGAVSVRSVTYAWTIEHLVIVTGATGSAVASYTKKNQQFHNESRETTPFILSEAARLNLPPSDVRVFFTNYNKSALPEGLVLSATRVIDIATFLAEAADQRAEWAKGRAANVAARPKSADRVLRTVSRWDSYSQRLVSADTRESAIAQRTTPTVVLHAGDPLALRVLNANADNDTFTLRPVMQLIAQEAYADNVTFVLLARNHKVENLSLTYTELSDWMKDRLSKIAVRTPMERTAELFREARLVYRGIPRLSDTQIARINDPELRSFYQGYMKKFDDGMAGEVAKILPELAVTQPKPLAYDPIANYPLLPQLREVLDDGERLIVDYFNMVDSIRSKP